MIDPQNRFIADTQSYSDATDPDADAECDVWDWDQLRRFKVKGTARALPPEEDREVDIVAKIADLLSPEVRSLTVDDMGLLLDVSTDPNEDDTLFVPYLAISVLDSSLSFKTVFHSDMLELDRLGAGVDLSTYKTEKGLRKTVAFKFNPWGKPVRLQMHWKELNILVRLPPHPNILPFDRIVLDKVGSRIVGFTTKYIPGQSLNDTSIPFRFEWLKQLTEVVDFLNLELGVRHQDIAPRNLLIDPDTEKLLLFDFDWAACGRKSFQESRSDVVGVVFTLHELITKDTHFASDVPHGNRKMEMVQSIAEWVPNRLLDSDVSTFRRFLNEWVARRTSDTDTDQYLNAPRRLELPDLPAFPEYEVPYELSKTTDGKSIMTTGLRLRRTALELGQYCFRWERPPQSRLLRAYEEDMPEEVAGMTTSQQGLDFGPRIDSYHTAETWEKEDSRNGCV